MVEIGDCLYVLQLLRATLFEASSSLAPYLPPPPTDDEVCGARRQWALGVLRRASQANATARFGLAGVYMIDVYGVRPMEFAKASGLDRTVPASARLRIMAPLDEGPLRPDRELLRELDEESYRAFAQMCESIGVAPPPREPSRFRRG